MLRPVALRERVGATDWLTARFWNAGHILGSTSIETTIADAHGKPETTLLFSGDLGPGDKAFHDDPEGPAGIDHLILESTYGGRTRPPLDGEARRAALADTLDRAIARGGPILMPVFAVERTQELLFDIDVLMDEGRLPALEIFLDSPLAIRATEAFDRHLPEINRTGTPHPFRRPNLHTLMEAKESARLERLRGPALIMAGSGMCDAGRIRQHLADHIWRPETTLVIVGYQAPGTLGRLIVEGKKTIRIHGQEVAVAAAVETLDAYSGHADGDALVDWAVARRPVRGTVFLTHGEDAERTALAARLDAAGFHGERILQPTLDARYALEPGGQVTRRKTRKRRAEPRRVAAPADWHNRYADASVRLAEALRSAPDDATRRRLLDRIEKALAEAERKSRRK